MAAELDGPRLEPKAAAPARQLVVFLHGYGADGNDLIEIGRAWQPLLPDTRLRLAACAGAVRAGAGRAAVVSAHLPRSRTSAGIGVNKAAPVLERFLDAELARRTAAAVGARAGRLQPGHHDGAACGIAPRRRAPRAIVGYSGMLSSCRRRRPTKFVAEIKSRPPVLLVHGDRDELIPVQALLHATQALAALGVPVEWHISAGIGHGIDQEGLRHGGEFLARQLWR